MSFYETATRGARPSRHANPQARPNDYEAASRSISRPTYEDRRRRAEEEAAKRRAKLDALEAELSDERYSDPWRWETDEALREREARMEARRFPRSPEEHELVRECRAGALDTGGVRWRRSAAYHEAGHLVMLAIEGRRPRGAVIFRHGGGRAFIASGEQWPVTADVAGSAAARLAGFHDNQPSDSDLRGATNSLAAAGMSGGEADEWLRRAEDTAERHLTKNWRAVQAVAGHLVAAGWIDGTEALRVMSDAGLRRA